VAFVRGDPALASCAPARRDWVKERIPLSSPSSVPSRMWTR